MMKYSINLLNYRTLKVIFNKYLRSKFNERTRVSFEMLKLKKINLCVNNFCNLQCFSCVSLCDKPLGENVWRDKRRIIDPDDLYVALKVLTKIEKYEAVIFAGGEPTAIPIKKLEKLGSVVRENNLKSIILTNGYRVNFVDPWKFDYFTLDNHGINEEDIKKSIRHFENKGFTNYKIISTKIHSDFNKAREKNIISPGIHCKGWGDFTIWMDLIYPCCAMPQLEGWDNDTLIRDSLFDAGYTISNPNLEETLKNWKKTIPGEVLKKCYFSCWKGHKEYDEHSIAREQLGAEDPMNRGFEGTANG